MLDMKLDTISPFNGKSLVGLKFGRLSVLHYVGKDRQWQGWWKCVCDCGYVGLFNGSVLNSGETQSCGCLHREIVSMLSRTRTKHGYTVGGKVTPEYRAWSSMLTRCSNRKYPGFKRYGGRGITACKRWHDFRNFLADMGIRPQGKTLERKNNDGNYEPGNCRWATPKDQARNTCTNRVVKFRGRKACLAEWSELLNISYQVLRWRLIVAKWPTDRALTEPIRHYA
jgi:hypothetical protein